MARKKDYIPRPHIEFNEFQIGLVALVVLNEVAWGIANTKVLALSAAKALYQPFYDAIVNPNTSTKVQILNHKVQRKVYEKIVRLFVKENLKFNSAISAGEKEEMRIPNGVPVSGNRPAITTAPHVSLKSLGGLQVLVECRVESDSSRPSMHPDSDGIEMRSAISSKPPVSSGSSTPHPAAAAADGDNPPANFEEAPNVNFSSKARFIRLINKPELAGKYLYVFARYKNLTDDTKSGPWSVMTFVIIT